VHPPVSIDPPFHLRPEEAYRSVSAIPSEGVPPLLAQIEPLLGEETLPDPTFFIESWTLGASTAAENFRRRQAKPAPDPHVRSQRVIDVFPLLFSAIAPAPHASPAATIAAAPARLFTVPPASDVNFSSFHATAAAAESPNATPPSSGPVTPEHARRLLGVAAGSTRDEIKTAYRQLASRCHPDRLTHASPQDSAAATGRMASLNAAYRLLCSTRF
jgi:hypothetical protein